MVIRVSYDVQIIQAPDRGAFSKEIVSEQLLLSNYRVLDVLLSFDNGESDTIIASFMAQDGDSGAPSPIPFLMRKSDETEFSPQPSTGAPVVIGGSDESYFIFRVSSDMLAKLEADRVVFRTTTSEGSTLEGAVIGLLFSPRYDPGLKQSVQATVSTSAPQPPRAPKVTKIPAQAKGGEPSGDRNTDRSKKVPESR